jgi:hypothetical protein
MRCAIEWAAIGFGFDNDPGNTFAISSGDNEQLTEQVAGDGYNVRAGVKISWEFCDLHLISYGNGRAITAKTQRRQDAKRDNKARALVSNKRMKRFYCSAYSVSLGVLAPLRLGVKPLSAW